MKFCFNEEILELPTFFRIWSFTLGLFASSAIPGFTLTQQATGQLGRANCNSLKTTLVLPKDMKERCIIDPVNAQSVTVE